MAEQILHKIETGEINPDTELGIKRGRQIQKNNDNGDKQSVSDMLNQMNSQKKEGYCCKSN